MKELTRVLTIELTLISQLYGEYTPLSKAAKITLAKELKACIGCDDAYVVRVQDFVADAKKGSEENV